MPGKHRAPPTTVEAAHGDPWGWSAGPALVEQPGREGLQRLAVAAWAAHEWRRAADKVVGPLLSLPGVVER
ncbi:hypothetical protein NDU88_003021 [Pleurodeles waltl]|uniref:Uncharacterized protein n=1 Tax=Pleurodeles waltl TaxID=8319 RepID=A0AAV7MPD7_PLEWA|nr:hypothetical protein NDU88_003021 [Pleurodeles waltl]